MDQKLDKERLALMNKIQDAKEELRQNPPQKSGYNKHGKYKYYELEDIIPPIERMLRKYGLGSWNDYKDGIMYIGIWDKETGAYKTWETPLDTIQGQENGFDTGVHMKANQSAQTYARRTLWLQIFDLLEKNIIEMDKKDPKKSSKEAPKKPSKPRADQIIKPIRKEPEPEEITPEMVEDVLNRTEEVLIDNGKPFTVENATWNINKLCKGNKQLASACINKLKIITADKVDKT